MSRTLMTRSLCSAALIAFAAAVPPAAAHVTLEQREAPAQSYYKAQLRITHGCKGSPTVRVRVRLPEGVLSVRPQPKPGWTVETTKVKLAKPIEDGHGNKITETVGEVAWSGGRLPDEHFDEFAVMMRLPDRPGAMLYFPVVQECEQGVHRWIEIPGPGKSARDYREPAPALRLTPAK
jgi:periplasmic copper chaperone A